MVEDTCLRLKSMEAAVDNCPERVDAVEEFGKIETVEVVEASMPPRIETAVGLSLIHI